MTYFSDSNTGIRGNNDRDEERTGYTNLLAVKNEREPHVKDVYEELI